MLIYISSPRKHCKPALESRKEDDGLNNNSELFVLEQYKEKTFLNQVVMGKNWEFLCLILKI